MSKYGRRRLKLKRHDARPTRRLARRRLEILGYADFKAARRADPAGARDYDLKN